MEYYRHPTRSSSPWQWIEHGQGRKFCFLWWPRMLHSYDAVSYQLWFEGSNSAVIDTIAAARTLVGHFRHSTKATKALKTTQRNLNTETATYPKHRLIQDITTCWNSTFYMLERLLEQKKGYSFELSRHEKCNKFKCEALESCGKNNYNFKTVWRRNQEGEHGNGVCRYMYGHTWCPSATEISRTFGPDNLEMTLTFRQCDQKCWSCGALDLWTYKIRKCAP